MPFVKSGNKSLKGISPEKKHSTKSSKPLAVLKPRVGQRDDVVTRLMKKAGIPVTRDRYLKLAFMGDPEGGLGGEEEANLPESLQDSNEEAPLQDLTRRKHPGQDPDDEEGEGIQGKRAKA